MKAQYSYQQKRVWKATLVSSRVSWTELRDKSLSVACDRMSSAPQFSGEKNYEDL